MHSWLLVDPVYSNEPANICLWQSFPVEDQPSAKVFGIDLAWFTHNGQYWAIHCKFHGENIDVAKCEIDSFLTNSSRSFTDPATGKETHFYLRYCINSNERFSANAEEMLHGQLISVLRLTLENLFQSSVDWEALYLGKKEQRKIKVLFPHQIDALDKSILHFAGHDRSQLILVRETGKSYTSRLIAEKLAPKSALDSVGIVR